MPTKSKKTAGAEAVALAEAMLRELQTLQASGGASYPPTLRDLAARTGLATDDDLIRAAAKKPAFTKPLDPLEKVDKVPSLDGRVYLKGTKPKPDPAGDLARRMVAVLQSLRSPGSEAYPPSLRRLAELCDRKPTDALVGKAVKHAAFGSQALIATKGKANLDAPVVLKEDVEPGSPGVLAGLLRYGLEPLSVAGTGKNKGKTTETTAFTTAEIAARFAPALKPLMSRLDGAIERQELPEGVGWILSKGKAYLFLATNIRGSAARLPLAEAAPTAPAADVEPPPAADFAGAFREAFDQLDRRNGATNFVKLADLRRVLDGYGREAFDVGLRALRVAGEFSLDSHEGLHGSLTPDEREAGVREAGSLLVYASRR